MSLRVVTKLSLFFVVLAPPLASAQQHSTTTQQIPAAHMGACEAFIQSTKFPKSSDDGHYDAKDDAASVAAFHQMWVSYQRQAKLKQADFMNSVCLTEWDARISSIPRPLMERAGITVQPDVVWGDITSTIVRLKRAISLAEERGDTQENLEWWRSRLDYFQTSLTSKDPKNSVLPNFVDIEIIGPQLHIPNAGSPSDGFWPSFSVEDRAVGLALNNVSFTCKLFDAKGNVVWNATISIPQISPLQTAKVAAGENMVRVGSDEARAFGAAINNNGSFNCDKVQFDAEPTTADVETIVKNSSK